MIHANFPFLGSAPLRVEASRPQRRLLGLKGSGVAAAPPPIGTAGPPTGSIATAGTADAGRHVPPGRAAAPPHEGTTSIPSSATPAGRPPAAATGPATP